jgi:3'-phosphoadenosine 5'-phosphosulfate sulfotransferase
LLALAASETKHGRFTKIEKAKAKARAQRVGEIWKELNEIEN